MRDATETRFALLEIDDEWREDTCADRPALVKDAAVNLAVDLERLRRAAREAEKQAKLVEGRLRKALGDRRSLELPGGLTLGVAERAGRTSWKDVAEELALVAGDDAFRAAVEAHVGEPSLAITFAKRERGDS